MINQKKGKATKIYSVNKEKLKEALDSVQEVMEQVREKILEEIEKNCKGYEDRTVDNLLHSTFWQALKGGNE